MKLWLLTLKPHLQEPWYDKTFGMVIRAKTEQSARNIASNYSGDEGKSSWFDKRSIDCIELMIDGPEELIIRDKRDA